MYFNPNNCNYPLPSSYQNKYPLVLIYFFNKICIHYSGLTLEGDLGEEVDL